MRKIGKVKYNGKSTADLGVIVSGEASFDAAAPDYTSYQIPGKNGDLMLSNNRYLNIDVTYPAFIPADFEEKVQAIRNWMRSARSYARIEDNYDLLHFRLGMGKDVLPFEPSAENVGSNMSLVFDCKPQRFLYSGEEENQIGVWGPVQAASGDVVTFEDDENGAFKSISASIAPTQDLHGYDYPWPAGGGTNKYDDSAKTNHLITENGGTYNSDAWYLSDYCPIPVGTTKITMTWESDTSYYQSRVLAYDSEEAVIEGSYIAFAQSNVYSHTFDIPSNTAFVRVNYSHVISGQEFPRNNVRVNVGDRDLGFTPYSNICPITGRTEATVWRTGKNLLDSTSYSRLQNCTIVDGVVTATVSDTRRQILPVCQLYDGMKYVRGTERIGEFFSWRFTKTNDVNVITFGHTGASKDIKIYYPIAHLKDGMEYVFSANVISAIEPFSWDSMMICNSMADYSIFTPYSGTSYPVSWQSEAGTVYGGTVDVVSGVLTSTMKYIIVDGDSNIGKENTGWANNYEAFYINISANKGIQPPSTLDPNALSNQLRIVSYQDLRRGDRPFDFSFTSSGNYIDWTSTSMTLEEEKARLAETPIYICYELATPQTYQLSGQQIKTLLGLNNVWADSGTVTAEWGEDPFGLYNPTLFDALPLIKVKNPQNGCTVTVNGTTMTCSRRYTGTVTIDCELMDVSSGATNLNADWSKDFPKLSPGDNSVAFSGADAVTIIPRWWEL